jgi:hypothetical protein
MRELEAQRRIVTSLKKTGGWGMKNNNEFNVGIPDLTLLKNQGAMQQVEVKRLILTGNTKLIGLKRRQYEELMDIRKAGGISFVIVYAEWGNNRYLYRILDVSDADKTRLDPNDPRILSVNVTRIATWDIPYLLFDDVGSFHRALDTATSST